MATLAAAGLVEAARRRLIDALEPLLPGWISLQCKMASFADALLLDLVDAIVVAAETQKPPIMMTTSMRGAVAACSKWQASSSQPCAFLAQFQPFSGVFSSFSDLPVYIRWSSKV